ncbi:hypothetical protein [Tahibacter amnicola]|uniref:Cellulose binding domain-containing protein n=1 Tax=Tahibacter amnicola TaxID=2976241 RepID=A0ABY6BNP1_9GAMM|nr:hypothetical protein [Tahibacter amnicola]UXI70181.1 hypothetical protein N4264_11280 [Tahibacter amnicola]
MNRVPALWISSVAATLLGLSTVASAVPVRWVIMDSRFEDGGVLSGTFVFDADTRQISQWNVSVSGGGVVAFPPFTYDEAAASGVYEGGYGNPQDSVILQSRTSERQLRVTPNAAFTNAGGTVPINLNTAQDHSAGLECYNCGPARIIVSGNFVGTPVTTGFVLAPSISGNWYDPAQNGHGFQIEVLPGGVATAFWFTFDNAGNPVWINAAGSIGAQTISMDARRVLGGRFPPNFNAATITTPVWGTLRFAFTGCNSGSVTWTTVDPAFTASGTMVLQRLTSIEGLACP